jgi:hypothetical protein
MPKEGIDEVEPLSPGFSDTLDADHDDAPLRLRSMESILGGEQHLVELLETWNRGRFM